MKKYILKDGTSIEAIPVGKAKIKIGDISPDGMLTICDRGPNLPNSRKARVICKCQCGNYTVINAQSFYDGTTKSCGCYAQQLHRDLCREVGKRPNKAKDYTQIDNPYYEFIERVEEKDSNNSFYWLVKCKKCGQIYKVVPSYLVSSSRRRGDNPCSCWRNQSKGVLKIKQLLELFHISYKQEYSYQDCLSQKGNKMKFDFFLPEYNCLIEYDGEQHFEPMSFGAKNISGKERLKLNQEYDDIKNQYCLKHNISLIRIPYSQYEELQIQDLLPISSNYLIKEEM